MRQPRSKRGIRVHARGFDSSTFRKAHGAWTRANRHANVGRGSILRVGPWRDCTRLVHLALKARTGSRLGGRHLISPRSGYNFMEGLPTVRQPRWKRGIRVHARQFNSAVFRSGVRFTGQVGAACKAARGNPGVRISRASQIHLTYDWSSGYN